jgi:hypothetical protein
LRPWRRSAHFVIYGKPTGQPARLGLVIGKKYAPRAVTRNLVKRLARDAFRLRRAEFAGYDLLLRQHALRQESAAERGVRPARGDVRGRNPRAARQGGPGDRAPGVEARVRVTHPSVVRRARPPGRF